MQVSTWLVSPKTRVKHSRVEQVLSLYFDLSFKHTLGFLYRVACAVVRER
jgi:hypothetical protein